MKKALFFALCATLFSLFLVKYLLKNEDTKSEGTYKYQTWTRKYFEQYMPEAYIEPNGEKNVGFGHSIKYGAANEMSFISDGKVDLREASDLMQEDYEKEFKKVKKLLPSHTDYEQKAVAELFYNCNQKRLIKSSLYRKIKNHEDCEKQWHDYCKFKNKDGETIYSQGLKERREFDYFLYSGNFEEVKRLGEKYRDLYIKRDVIPAKEKGMMGFWD